MRTNAHCGRGYLDLLYESEICGEWFDGCEVNHKDENKHNNSATNLEVCTGSYNRKYGTASKRTAAKNTNGKLSRRVIQYDLNWKYISDYPSIAEAHRHTGVNGGSISAACSGKMKSAGNFYWRYMSKDIYGTVA